MLRLALSSKWKVLPALAVFSAFFIAKQSFAQPDPPAQAGRISVIQGNVSYQPQGSDEWGQAVPNAPLGPGDRIFTDENSRAEIQVGQTYVRIGPNSDVSLVDLTPDGLYFGVGQGSVHLHTFGLWEGQSVYVSTPSGSSTLARAGELRIDVYPSDPAAVFTNYGGFQQITGANDFEQDLVSGGALELVGSNPVQAQWIQPDGWDDLDQWSHSRDQFIERAQSYRYVSPEIPGAYELDAAGTWEAGTPYGAVWYPNDVPAGWAPYHNGHWVNRAPWGWVWVEDEPWGYAPFHYGRWVSYRGRWGWVAGPPAAHPVWSPALVVFAGGIQFGGGGVSAWFPLGPGEPYRPWYRCSDRYVDQVNITNIVAAPRVQVQRTYVNINVTNITYVNQTIAVTAVRQQDFAAGRSVRQAAVNVDVHQLAHIQPAPVAQLPPPPARPIVGPAPVRPVPVVARPTLINQRGLAIQAAAGARPVPPPVREVPMVRPLPGRTVVAPPPNAKPIPAANAIPANNRPGQFVPPQQPGQTNRPGFNNQQPAPQPGQANHPGFAPNQPAAQPVPPQNRPLNTAQPTPQPAPQNRPGFNPGQPEAQPGRPNNQVQPPPQQIRPNTENQPRPAPEERRPPQNEDRPVPPPAVQHNVAPPPPAERPQFRPPQPEPHPNAQPMPPKNDKPAPPPKEDKKEKDKKKEPSR